MTAQTYVYTHTHTQNPNRIKATMKKLKTYFIYFRDIFLLQWGTVKINCREHTPCHPEVETCLNRTFLKSSWLKWKHKTDSAVHSSQDMAHSTWSLVQPSKRKKEHFVIIIRAQIGAASWLLFTPPAKKYNTAWAFRNKYKNRHKTNESQKCYLFVL